MPTLLPIVDSDAPEVQLAHLDDLWFQVGGTLCNLACRHCFISCSPHNDSFGFLTLAQVEQFLHESVTMGVKEYYFTGGEPFLNRDMTAIIELTLKYGPATVLTNGTVFKDPWLKRLAAAESQSPYSLEFRVSIDGFSAETNDPVRGEGTFNQAMAGVRQLVQHGFLPIISITRTSDDQEETRLVQGFTEALRSLGYLRPRLKILPTLRIGAEAARQRGYFPDELISAEMMRGFDPGQLLCSRARIVTDRGVYVCPILLDARDARMGGTLDEAAGGYRLRHHACYTCYQHGSICANPAAVQRNA